MREVLQCSFTFAILCFSYKLSYLGMKVAYVMPLKALNSQDLITHSPYCLQYNLCGVSLENLVLDQLIIPKSMFFFFLITCLLDIVLVL